MRGDFYTNIEDYQTIPLLHVGTHTHPFLLPKYSIIKRVTQSVRTVKVWQEGADALLQHQFQHKLESIPFSGHPGL